MKTSIYIHIPFCTSKCKYCDFASFPSKIDKQFEYFEALKKEIINFKKKKNLDVYTIYIGGGTPSLVNPKYIEEVLTQIKKSFSCDNIKEISIEMNPNTVTRDKIQKYKKMGINRFSLGLQTTNDKFLKKIGRVHTYAEFLESVRLLKSEKVYNINVDLIYNLPNQKKEDVLVDIQRLAKLDIQHISFYSLTLMEGTPLYEENLKGELQFPDEDEEREMYHCGIEELAKFGYNQYEISNFAKENFECLHNMVYWETKPYIGFGLGAYSYFENNRFNNYDDFEKYIGSIQNDKVPCDILKIETIDYKEQVFEYLMLNLRMNSGLNVKKYEERFNEKISAGYLEIFDELINEKLLCKTNEGYKLTLKGIDLSNYVFEKIML